MGAGRGTQRLAEALASSERKAEELEAEVASLRLVQDQVFKAPPQAWVEQRIAELNKVLQRRTARSALLLRDVLGPIRMQPVYPEVGRPFYRATTSIGVIPLLAAPSSQDEEEGGSKPLR